MPAAPSGSPSSAWRRRHHVHDGAGIATSVMVLIMVIASITLLPAFLGLAGDRMKRLSLHRRRRGAASGTRRATWTRWGRHVSDHAVALCRWGQRVSCWRSTAPVHGTAPWLPRRRYAAGFTNGAASYDLVAEGFGPGRQRAPADRRRHLRAMPRGGTVVRCRNALMRASLRWNARGRQRGRCGDHRGDPDQGASGRSQVINIDRLRTACSHPSWIGVRRTPTWGA